MNRALAFGLLLMASALPVKADVATPGIPPGWTFGGANPESYEAGTEVAERMAAGKQAAYIKAASGAGCGTSALLFQTIRADAYRGKRVRLGARLRGEKVTALQLFLGVEQPGGRIQRFFQPQYLTGTWDWTRTEAVMDVPADAEVIALGFRLGGPLGTGWVDEVRFDVVGDALAASTEREWVTAADATNFCRCVPLRLLPEQSAWRARPVGAGQGALSRLLLSGARPRAGAGCAAPAG